MPAAARRRKFAKETRLGLVRRARRMVRTLAVAYPDAHCELDFATPLELAVATILSAQSTDKMINKVTPAVFARYRTAADYAGADRAELEELIRPTGFYRNKATALIGLGAALVERFDGELPRKLDALVTLPGIGRKTANVILGNAFGVPGITVDTHFGRLVRRFGWTGSDDPVKVEHEVGELIPKRDWTMASHWLIFHGRRVCHARRPACGACTLAPDCPSFGLGPTSFEEAARLVKGPETEHLLALAQAARAGVQVGGPDTPDETAAHVSTPDEAAAYAASARVEVGDLEPPDGAARPGVAASARVEVAGATAS